MHWGWGWGWGCTADAQGGQGGQTQLVEWGWVRAGCGPWLLRRLCGAEHGLRTTACRYCLGHTRWSLLGRCLFLRGGRCLVKHYCVVPGRPQRHNAPQDRAPIGILSTFCSFVEILYVQNNLACYGLGMRQPAYGCNVRAKRLTHFILTFLS
jgi:hypothetical protein